MDERELTESLPNEVVEVFRQKDYREVVEVYTRPLPWLAAPTPKFAEQPQQRKRSKKGLVIFLVCFTLVVVLSAAGWLFSRLWAPESASPYFPDFTGDSAVEVLLPTWPTGQGAELEVVWDHDETMPIQEIYRKVNPSVVTVMAWQGKDGASVGTGVAFTEDGYVLTNHHVVRGSDQCLVALEDGTSLEAAYVAGDPEYDLAILKINVIGMPAAEFGESDRLVVGDPAYAIGNPLGIELRGTLTDGIISAINRDVVVEGHTMTLLQTNAALNSGNSGGPLINQYGQVVGINVVKMATTEASDAAVEGLGFAIPTAILDRVVNDLLTYGEVQPEPLLGISVYTAATQLEDDLWGAGVESVVPGGAGDRAGIRAGDYVLSSGEIEITTSQDVLRARRQYRVGDEMPMTIWREGDILDVTLQLTEAVE